MTTDRATELRDAFRSVVPERLDVQFVLHDLDTYTGEEVNVYSINSERPLRYVPLPTRRATYQLNWRALDESGQNLVILSRYELDEIYRDLFEDAIAYLRARRDLPPFFESLVRRETWADDLFEGRWVERIRQGENQSELGTFFSHMFGRFPPSPGPRQLATYMLAEYVAGKLQGFYRPWVQLSKHIETSSGIPEKILIKYESDERVQTATADKIGAAFFGWLDFVAKLPYSENCSTHVRLRASEGMAFRHPFGIPLSDPAPGWNSKQIQVYLPDPTDSEETSPTAPLVVKTRLTQTVALRLLVATFFLLVGLLPLVVAWAGFLRDSDGVGLSVSLYPSFSGFALILGLVGQDEVQLASGLSLPIAIALLASAWEKPPVRAFVITQLALSLLLLVIWLFAAVTAWAGLIALALGAVAVGVNLGDAVVQQSELSKGSNDTRKGFKA